MLKKKYVIIFLIILLILSISIPIKGETNAIVKLNSNKNVIENGEEIEITISISEKKTAAYDAILNFDETKFDLISRPENANIDEGQIKLVWYDIKGGKRCKTG